MYLGKQKIFLAGATGMIGSGIIEYLLENFPNTRIRAAYHKNTKAFIRNKRIEYVFCDLLSDKDCLRAASGCDCAVMAAAVAENAATFSKGVNYFRSDNIVINLNMLKAFSALKPERVIFLSSATVYSQSNGRLKEDGLDLNQEPNARQFYTGWSFRFIEQMCRFWQEETRRGMIILRLANVFGPYARFNPGNSNFIPALIRKASQKIDPFIVWGAPDVTRDVLYRKDAAAAIVCALNAVKIKSGCFNVGSGEATKVADVVKCVTTCAEYSPKIKYDKNGPATVKARVLDVSKISRLLGWSAQVTPHEGIRKTFQWWQENKRRWKK